VGEGEDGSGEMARGKTAGRERGTGGNKEEVGRLSCLNLLNSQSITNCLANCLALRWKKL